MKYDVKGGTDVLIVGGGPAGLAAAIAARQVGLRVTVADCAVPPIDKACGEGLMPDSLEALAGLGVELDARNAGMFRGIRFVGERDCVSADFPRGRGIGIRRTLLHSLLVKRAAEARVEMIWGARVSALSARTAMINGERMNFAWLIGADGQNSQVRKWARLDACRERHCRVSLRQHFPVSPWSEYVEIHWGTQGQAYVTPISPQEVCVALISRKRWESFDAGIEQFAQLSARLRGAAPSSRIRGSLSVTRRLKRVSNDNVALIGEASGSVDAITGEGLALAFRQARVLARCMVAGDLGPYEAAHRQIGRVPEYMATAMLLMDKSSWACRRTLRAFAKQPELFTGLLRFHVGESWSTFGFHGAANLGWHMLTA